MGSFGKNDAIMQMAYSLPSYRLRDLGWLQGLSLFLLEL